MYSKLSDPKYIFELHKPEIQTCIMHCIIQNI